MNEEKKPRLLEEEKLDKVTGGAVVSFDDSGKTYQLKPDDSGDPIGTYEVSQEGAKDPNEKAKSLGQ